MSRFPTCQVCHKQFSLKGPAPFLLPCLHSVCETCVTSAAGGVISCSTCQRDVNLTEIHLQKDVVTKKEILHLTVNQHPELILCTNEDDGNQAVCWCKECRDFLCEHCQMTHGRIRIARQHAVEDIGDFHPKSFDMEEYCTIHPRYPLDTWDEQCCILICRKCIDGEHTEHSNVDFSKAIETARREVSGFGDQVLSSVAQHATHLATIDSDLYVSNGTCDNLSENISLTFNTLKSLMDQREKELQIELQQHQEQVRRKLNEKKKTSECSQKKCQAISDYISKTLQYSSDHDIMSLRNILQSKTKDCFISSQTIVHESPHLPNFATDGLEKIKSALTGFGSIALNDDPPVAKHYDCGTQTADRISTECEKVMEELMYLKTMHEKEIQILRETLARKKEEDENGLYVLIRDVSDAAFLLNCTRVEFSTTKYNDKYVHINTEGELINSVQSFPPCNDQRLKKYEGTIGNTPLPQCGCPSYFEVNTKIEIKKFLRRGNLLLEIGLAREDELDQHHWIAQLPKSHSLIIKHCHTHSSICRKVWGHGKYIQCLPNTLENTPGTSSSLHVGVVYDSVRSRIAFLDVKG